MFKEIYYHKGTFVHFESLKFPGLWLTMKGITEIYLCCAEMFTAFPAVYQDNSFYQVLFSATFLNLPFSTFVSEEECCFLEKRVSKVHQKRCDNFICGGQSLYWHISYPFWQEIYNTSSDPF